MMILGPLLRCISRACFSLELPTTLVLKQGTSKELSNFVEYIGDYYNRFFL